MAAAFPSPQCSFWKSREESKFPILELPDHIIRNVLSFFSYTELCELRRVCKVFNTHSQYLLTQGFARVDRYHSKIQKHVKSLLPRRESERRNHPLARHVDILSAIETRLSLLSMTYSKYMDLGLCCFIPGKVLDELWKILKILRNETSQPPRAHEFLQELRDISSMAMEHFEEHIVPTIKHLVPPGPLSYTFTESFPSVDGLGTPCLRRQEMQRMKQLNRSTGADIQKDVNKLKNKVTEQQRTLGEQDKKVQEKGKLLSELEKKILDKGKVIEEQERKIQEQGRLLTEQEKKILDQGRLIAEQRAKTEKQESKLNSLVESMTAWKSHLNFLTGEVASLKGVKVEKLEDGLKEAGSARTLAAKVQEDSCDDKDLKKMVQDTDSSADYVVGADKPAGATSKSGPKDSKSGSTASVAPVRGAGSSSTTSVKRKGPTRAATGKRRKV